MGIENPGGEKEISNLEKTNLARLASRYKRICEDEMATGDSRSMRHFLNNLCLSLDPILFQDEYWPIVQSEIGNNVRTSVLEIKRYFGLLKKYPEFKAGEKAGKLGYFADKGIKVKVKIDAYEEKLKESFPSKTRKKSKIEG